jgi:(S)-2-hydroxy-acid oxidase
MESEPVNVHDMYEIAKKKLPKPAWDYFSSGADDQFTLRDTRRAFEAIKLKARALTNADNWEGTQTSILGHKISSPICIAPTAF